MIEPTPNCCDCVNCRTQHEKVWCRKGGWIVGSESSKVDFREDAKNLYVGKGKQPYLHFYPRMYNKAFVLRMAKNCGNYEFAD